MVAAVGSVKDKQSAQRYSTAHKKSCVFTPHHIISYDVLYYCTTVHCSVYRDAVVILFTVGGFVV